MAKNTAVNSSHTDANQVPSLVLVAGTLGTADIGGTAQTMPAAGNAITGAAYVEIINGTVTPSGGTQAVRIVDGTITNISTGTIAALASGTITAGTFNLGTVVDTPLTGFEGGTVSIGTAVVELTFTGITKSIMIEADHNNGTMVYLGPSSVTQLGANSIHRLDPGESVAMDLNDAAAPLYAVAGTTGQKIYKLALT